MKKQAERCKRRTICERVQKAVRRHTHAYIHVLMCMFVCIYRPVAVSCLPAFHNYLCLFLLLYISENAYVCVNVCGLRVDEVYMCMCVCFAAVICSLVKCAQILPRFNFYLLEFLLLIIYNIYFFSYSILFSCQLQRQFTTINHQHNRRLDSSTTIVNWNYKQINNI